MRKTDAGVRGKLSKHDAFHYSCHYRVDHFMLQSQEAIMEHYVKYLTLRVPDNTVSLIMFAIILERYLTPFLTNKA